MKMKSFRLATALAVLLALCLVFVMPAAADDTIDTWAELKSAFSNDASSSISLGGNIFTTVSTDTDKIIVTTTKSLDLNGFNLTVQYTGDTSYAIITATSGGVFTLTDSKGNGEVNLVSTGTLNANDDSVAIFKAECGTVIIDGRESTTLTVKNTQGSIGVYGIDVLTHGENGDASLTVKGGTIESTYGVIRGFANSGSNTVYITIEGGKLTSPVTGIWIQQPGNKVCPYYLKITGGEVFGKNQALYYTICNVAESDAFRLTEITGGVIRNNNDNSDNPTRNPPRAAIRYDLGTHYVNENYEYYVTSMENHQLKITGGEVKNEAGGSTVVYNSYSTVAPTLIGVEISGLESVTSDDFIGMFSIPAFGKSYVWAVNGEEIVGETTNELTYTFSSVADATQIVSVTVTCSDQCTYTYTKSVIVPETYTVSFVADGGEGTMNPVYAYSDNKVIELPGCTFTAPEGKVFDAWEIDGQKYAVGATYTFQKDTTVKALWKDAPTYTVTVTASPADGGSATASAENAVAGADIGLTATANDGYEFKEWQVISGEVTITDNKFTMPAANVEITAVFEEKEEEPVTPPTEVTPSISTAVSEDGKTITPSTGTTAEEFTEEDEIPIDADSIVGIYDASNPSVVLVVTEATIENGKVSLSDNSVVLAAYPEISSAVDSESEDAGEAVSVVVLIGMDKPDSASLPSFSGEFKDTVAEAVESVSDKDYKPLSMITATDNVDKINANRVSEKGAIGIAFTISDDLYQKYKGKFVALHVKGGKVTDTIQVTATPDEETGNWNLEISGDSFSSYVLAVDNTPKPEYTPTGSATDTGSGNYQYYPRDVPSNGIVSFGTSKVVTGIELPAGSSGKVTLNIKPDFAMPENGFYAFEIDAPGYNLAAKINGGLSFQIPVADLEAAGFTANDIVLFHGTVGEDGKITWEALPTNLVKNENGVAYYKAAIAGCSPFYIGFVKDGSVVNTEVIEPVIPDTPETPVTPDEPEVLPPVDTPGTPEQPAESPAPILGMVLGGLAAAVVLRRK